MKSMDIEQLTAFVIKASLPHAFNTSNACRQTDGSITITFVEGDWEFHDNFFGGEPYGGRAVVHYKGKPEWLMVYYGRVDAIGLTPDYVYSFLRQALQHPLPTKPYRGPTRFKRGNLEYRNTSQGTIQYFAGKEVILEKGKEIYQATYCGGLVDQRQGVGF